MGLGIGIAIIVASNPFQSQECPLRSTWSRKLRLPSDIRVYRGTLASVSLDLNLLEIDSFFILRCITCKLSLFTCGCIKVGFDVAMTGK